MLALPHIDAEVKRMQEEIASANNITVAALLIEAEQARAVAKDGKNASAIVYADDLGSAVHYALETTHAIAICPFHLDLTIRIGDDAAESHAFARARKLVKSDGTTWEGEALWKDGAADRGGAAD
jgi:hypothetical protein